MFTRPTLPVNVHDVYYSFSFIFIYESEIEAYEVRTTWQNSTYSASKNPVK